MAIDLNYGDDDAVATVTKIRKKGRQDGGFPRQKTDRRGRYQASSQEENMKTKSTQQTTDTVTPPGPSPFQVAMKAARAIKTRRPAEEQPAELAELKEALGGLDEKGRIKLLWRLINEVMDGKTPTQALFPVAYASRRMSMAHNAAALRRTIVEDDLTLSDLRMVGLAEIKFGENKRPYVRYIVNIAGFTAALPHLRTAGKKGAADLLAEHLRRADKNRQLYQAAAAQNAADENATAKEEDQAET